MILPVQMCPCSPQSHYHNHNVNDNVVLILMRMPMGVGVDITIYIFIVSTLPRMWKGDIITLQRSHIAYSLLGFNLCDNYDRLQRDKAKAESSVA